MLSFLPRFEVGDFVRSSKPYETKFYRIEVVHTKFLFFHSYLISKVIVESYDGYYRNPIDMRTISQSQLTKLTYYDIITLFSIMLFSHFGDSNRSRKPWTDIENNILEEVYPKLEQFDNPDVFPIDMRTIFGRSFQAIKTQYKKLTKDK